MLLAYPILDLALLAVALRLILGTGRRPTSFYLLVTSLLLVFAGDSFYSYQTLDGSYTTGGIDPIWLVGNLSRLTACPVAGLTFVACGTGSFNNNTHTIKGY